MSQMVLILGGARSGKSRYAQQLAEQLGGDRVLFVATAQAGDAEMAERIDHHRRSRRSTWQTLECPLGVGAALLATADDFPVIVIDCLTLLVSNAILADDALDFERAQQRVREETQSLLDACRRKTATVIIVSGEVGLGLVPETALGRMFRDLLGWANQALGAESTATFLLVGGHAIELRSHGVSAETAAARLLSSGSTQSTTTKQPRD